MNLEEENKQLKEEVRSLKEQLKKEQSFRDNEYERLKILSNNIPNGTLFRYEMDVNTRFRNFTYVGNGWEEVTGTSAAEALADTNNLFEKIIIPDDLTIIRGKIAESARDLSQFYCEFRSQIDGKISWLLMSADPHVERNKVCWDGIVMDITQRKIIERKLKKEHERLQMLSENIPDGVLYILILDNKTQNLRFDYIGSKCDELFGITQKEAIHDINKIFSTTYPGDLPVLMDLLMHSAQTLTSFSHEIRIIVRGKLRWFQVSSTPYQENDLTIWTGIIIDTTSRKTVEHQLKIEHERLESLSNNLPKSTIYRLISEEDTGKFYMQYVSENWENVTGLKPNDVAHDMTPYFNVVHPDDVEYIKATSDASKECIGFFSVEIRIKIEDDYRWLNITSKPYRHENNVIWDGIMTDITDRKEIDNVLAENRTELQAMVEELQATNEELHAVNEELYVAKEKATELERLKSAFLANFSHEVRTPISGIITLLGALQKEDFSEDVLEIITLIRNSSEHLLTLFNDILDEAKIESGQLTIHPEPVNIKIMIIETQLFFQNIMQKNKKQGVSLEISLDEIIDNHLIMADPVRLKQIMYNLLSNAVKFTHKGIINFGYRLADSETLEFWVKDTGVGIPANQLQNMFEPFRQAERSDKKRYGGTGLGLSISKNLAQLMGGDICAESTEGEGSKFYFFIPFIPQLD